MSEKPDENPYGAPQVTPPRSRRLKRWPPIFSVICPFIVAVVGFSEYKSIEAASPIGFDFRITYGVVGFAVGLAIGLGIDLMIRKSLSH